MRRRLPTHTCATPLAAVPQRVPGRGAHCDFLGPGEQDVGSAARGRDGGRRGWEGKGNGVGYGVVGGDGDGDGGVNWV